GSRRHRPDGIESIAFTEVDTFPPPADIEPGQLFALSLSGTTTAFTHGLHRFAAKFVPQVPAWALDHFGSRASVVLDPFMGSGTRRKHPPDVAAVFWRFLRRAVDGLADLNRKRHGEAAAVIPDDADATALGLVPGCVDLAVTSPPYLDSVDYPYNMMVEYFWLGPLLGVPDRRAFNAVRRRPIGPKPPAELA